MSEGLYEIVGEIERGQATVAGVISDCYKLGLDRAALVRRADVGHEAALMIAMLTDGAVRAIGPIIKEAGERFVSFPPEAKPVEFEIFPDQRVAHLFELMEQKKTFFLWAVLELDRGSQTGPVVTFLLGQETCEWIAPRLTEAGCPCSLR